MERWLRLYPKLLRSEIMRCHANTFKVFFALLCMARWEDGEGLKRGQVRTTRRQLGHICRISENSVRGTESNLLKLGMIAVERTRTGTGGWSVITILNYNEYQYGGTERRTAQGTPEGTNGGGTGGDRQEVKMLDVKTLRKEYVEGVKDRAQVIFEIQRNVKGYKAQDSLMDEIFDGAREDIRREAIRKPMAKALLEVALGPAMSMAEMEEIRRRNLG